MVAGSSAVDGVPVLGAVKIVPPVGGSILTAPARWQVWAAVEEPAGCEHPRRPVRPVMGSVQTVTARGVLRWRVTGLGSDLSEELVWG